MDASSRASSRASSKGNAAAGVANLRLMLHNHSTISKNQLRQAMAQCGVSASDVDLARWTEQFGTADGRINCKKLLLHAANTTEDELNSVASSFFSHTSGVSEYSKASSKVPCCERLFAMAGSSGHREPPSTPSSAQIRLENFIENNNKYAHLTFEELRTEVAKLLSKKRFVVEQAAAEVDEDASGVMETEAWRGILDVHIFPIENESLFRLLKPFLMNDQHEVEYERFIEVLIDFFGSQQSSTAEEIPMEFFARSSRSGTPRTQSSASTARRMDKVLGRTQAAKMMSTPRGATPRGSASRMTSRSRR